MRTKLKVCCISSVAEARLAASLGASALGLVGAMPSGPGPIDDALIATIATQVPPPVSRFLLTSQTEPAAVVAHVRATHVDTVQLVDAVPEATYLTLRRELPHVRLVQVLHVEGEAQIAEAVRVAPHVHALLLDSGRPGAQVKELGGTGRVHDWSVSAAIVRAVDVPVFLAGGLRAENVGAAIVAVRPYGVDVCSGVREHGALSAARLEALVRALDEADATPARA